MTATLGDRSSTQTATTGASRPQLPFGLGPIPELPQIPGLPQLRLPSHSFHDVYIPIQNSLLEILPFK